MTYSVRNEWQKLRFEHEMEQRLFVNSNQLSRKVDLLADEVDYLVLHQLKFSYDAPVDPFVV